MAKRGNPRGKGGPGWVKGMPSPNPGGRPKSVFSLAELARQDVPEIFSRLLEIIRATPVENPTSAQMSAISMYLERALGRPIQPVAMAGSMNLTATGPDGAPTTALIVSAQRNAQKATYKRMLEQELKRLEAESKDENNEVAAGPQTGLQRLLAEARAVNAARSQPEALGQTLKGR